MRHSSALVAALTAVLALIMTMAGISPAAATPGSRTGLQSFDLDTTLAPSHDVQQLAQAGTAGYTCSRIPALTTANNGWVIASWDGRPGSCADAPQANAILYTISKDNGVTWGEVKILAQDTQGANKRGFSDPSFVVDRETGRIFNFFVMSYDWGWPQRDNTITDPRHVMHAVYYYSDDNGETWTGPTEVTDALNPEPKNQLWTGRFAASGEGIQLKYGAHAGRLIQQYTVYNTQTNNNWAVSLFSDDHGATWTAGTPVGPGMDENKVVELSDGRVMLNSRKSDGTGGRYIAYSTDGGATWSPRTTNQTLIDPQNNASIIRAFPNAPQGSAEAKVLLFSNSAAGSRVNGTIRISYDDGATWPDAKVFEPGAMAYSTMTTMADGTLGLLFEREYSTVYFSKLTWQWLGGTGISMTAQDEPVFRGANDVQLTIANTVGGPLQAGAVTLAGPTGVTGGKSAVPAIDAGGSATVTVPLTLPDNANPGAMNLTATYVVGGKTIVKQVSVRVQLRDGEVVVDPQLGVVLTRTSAPQDFYKAGDKVTFWVRVSNLANQNINAVPRAGDWTNLFPNCRWVNLSTQPTGNYNCGQTGTTGNTPPTYTITQADIDRGWFVPTMTWAVAAVADREALNPIQELTFEGARVELPTAWVTNDGPVTVPDEIAQGTRLTYKFTYRNTTAAELAVIPAAGEFANFHITGTPNCRYGALAAGASATCTTAVYTVTADDVAAGFVAPGSSFVIARDREGTQPLTTLQVVAPRTEIRKPAASIDPTTIAAGGKATVTVTQFPASSDATVALGDSTIGSGRTDAAGSASITVTVPATTAAGDHEVRVAAGSIVKTLQIRVTQPAMSVEPTWAGRGATATLTGWLPGVPVKVTLGRTFVRVTPDGAGSATATLPVSSRTPAGQYTVRATQGDRTVTTKVTVYHGTAWVTTPIVVSGKSMSLRLKGYGPGEVVTVRLGSKVIGTVTAGADGSASARLPIAKSTRFGVYVVRVTSEKTWSCLGVVLVL